MPTLDIKKHKINTMRFKFYILALLFFTGKLNAQPLQEFINTALKSHYGIRIHRYNAKIEKNKNTVGNAGMLPTLEINTNQQQNINTSEQVFFTGEKRSGEGAKTTLSNAQILLNWTVFDGFQMFAEKNKLKYLEEMGRLNARYQIDQSIADLIILYNQLIYESKQLKNLKQVEEISEYRLEIETKRRNVGSGNALAHQQALVDLQNDQIAVLSQEQVLVSLQIELNTLVNTNPNNPITIYNELQTFPDFDPDTLQNLIKNYSFEYPLQELEVLVAEKQVTIAKALKYPSINLVGGYAYSNNINEIGFIQKNQNYGNYVGLNVRMNLFNAGRNNLEIKNAQLHLQNSRYQKERLQQDLRNQGWTWYSEYVNKKQQYKLALENEKVAQRMADIAEQQFLLGTITGYEYRISQLSLLQTTQKTAELSYQLAVIQTHIHRLCGQILVLYTQ